MGFFLVGLDGNCSAVDELEEALSTDFSCEPVEEKKYCLYFSMITITMMMMIIIIIPIHRNQKNKNWELI
jgi:hypothetical protein